MSSENEPKPQKSSHQRRIARQKRVQTILKWLGYPSSGIGIATTFGLFKGGQPLLAIITGFASIGIVFLAIASKFCSELIDEVLDEIERRLEQKVKPLANWIVDGLEESVVKGWWRLTSKFQGKYYQQLIYACRDYKTHGLKTKGEFTLDFEKIFVPLRVSPESAQKISPEMIRSNVEKEGLTIWDFLVESRSTPQFRRLAIIGAPGSGKTTLMKDLTLTYARNRQRRQNQKAPKLIPILVYLRDIRDLITKKDENKQQYIVNSNISLATVIVQQESIAKLKPREGWFEEMLSQRDSLVMLDGLDEVADEQQRKAVSEWVNQQINSYQKARFILTSRPFGYLSAPVEEVKTILDVQPFNLSQMQQFIQNWYLQREIMSRLGKDDPGVRQQAQHQSNNLIERIRNNSALAALALNPLLLTMIATVHCYRGALPGRRVELYAEICDVLLGKRDEAKGISIEITPEQQKAVLQVLALELMTNETRKFSLKWGSSLIEKKLADVAGSKLKADDFLENIQTRSGLLVERENQVYEFAHKSFQEYLAAVQIKELNQESLLINQINNSWWEETIRLYAAQSDATNLIQAALEHPELISLKLALDCCDEGLSVNAQVRENLEREIEKRLESPEPEIFQLAAQVKLARRLSQLLRLDEQTAIDQYYITIAEYKLFAADQEINWSDFEPGSANKPVTGLSLEDVLLFCVWLRDKAALLKADTEEGEFFYRLPTLAESQSNPAQKDARLKCWTVGGNSIGEKGIRVVKAKIPSECQPLVQFLAGRNWEEADRETLAIMLKITNRENQGDLDLTSIDNFPCKYLSFIDQLWLHYSQGRLGFGMQVSIWEGSQDKDYDKLAETLGWHDGSSDLWHQEEEITFRLDAPPGHLPCLWWLNSSSSQREIVEALSQKFIDCGIERSQLFAFDVITVNNKGQKIQQQHHQAKYFSEDLGQAISLDMIYIPGGNFEMGTEEEEIERLCQKYNAEYFRSEKPQHQVTVQPFFMGRFPVTQAQWRAIASLPKVKRDLKSNPSRFKGDERPVEQVSWYDAVEFCARLSQDTGREYCLPSETQWEYACRAGTTTPFYFGETITTDLANYRGVDWEYKGKTYPGNHGKEPKGEFRKKTTPVGQFPPNAFGLYDMHGQLWEWCADTWHDNYENAPTDGSAWITENNDTAVLRGGSWDDPPIYCRSAIRSGTSRADDDNDFGFRVVSCFGKTS